MYGPSTRQLIRPREVGLSGCAHVCHGDTTSAAYADMYTRPEGDTATPGQNVTTRRGAAALSTPPFGCVTGHGPSTIRFEACSVGTIRTGSLHVAAPSQ